MTSTPAPARVHALERPTARNIARHLREHHRVPQAVLDAHLTKEHLAWHAAEHRYRQPATRDGAEIGRHPGHLRHTHPDPEPKKAKK